MGSDEMLDSEKRDEMKDMSRGMGRCVAGSRGFKILEQREKKSRVTVPSCTPFLTLEHCNFCRGGKSSFSYFYQGGGGGLRSYSNKKINNCEKARYLG